MDQNAITVSGFKNANDVNPQPVNLLKWLEGNPALNQLVDQIRAEPDKAKRNELKKRLPAITPSGTFVKRRADQLVKHSGYIALDFDNCDPQQAKNKLFNIVNVFYAGLSASGRGCWALIPIHNPEHHRRHFDALRADFEAQGLEVDPACKDVCRLRFYSYDLDPVFNLDAIPYRKMAPQPARRKPAPMQGNESALDRLINKIIDEGRDVTTDYNDWIKIAAALASIYGEAGRDKFQGISQFYPGYSPQETDKQFSTCLRNNPGYGPAMIFHIAKQYGVLLVEKHPF